MTAQILIKLTLTLLHKIKLGETPHPFFAKEIASEIVCLLTVATVFLNIFYLPQQDYRQQVRETTCGHVFRQYATNSPLDTTTLSQTRSRHLSPSHSWQR